MGDTIIENLFRKIDLMLNDIDKQISDTEKQCEKFTKARIFLEALNDDYHNLLSFEEEEISEVCSIVFHDKKSTYIKDLSTIMFVLKNEKVFSKRQNNPQLSNAKAKLSNIIEGINTYVLEHSGSYNDSIIRVELLNQAKIDANNLVLSIKNNEQIDIDSFERIVSDLELSDKEKYLLLVEIYKYCLSLESPLTKKDNNDLIIIEEETPSVETQNEQVEIIDIKKENETSNYKEYLDEYGNFKLTKEQKSLIENAGTILTNNQQTLQNYITQTGLDPNQMELISEENEDRIKRYNLCSDSHRDITVLLELNLICIHINKYLTELRTKVEEYKELCVHELNELLNILKTICDYYNNCVKEQNEEEKSETEEESYEPKLIYLLKGNNKSYFEEDLSVDKPSKISDDLKKGIIKGLKNLSLKNEDGTFSKDSSFGKTMGENITIHTSGICKILYCSLPNNIKLIISGDTQKEKTYTKAVERLIYNKKIIAQLSNSSITDLESLCKEHDNITQSILQSLGEKRGVNRNV